MSKTLCMFQTNSNASNVKYIILLILCSLSINKYFTSFCKRVCVQDHVRAAMTCIRFFTYGALSYVQLGEQQRWLIRAKEHLRAYLQEQQNRRKTFSSSSSSFRKKMSSSDISRSDSSYVLENLHNLGLTFIYSRLGK